MIALRTKENETKITSTSISVKYTLHNADGFMDKHESFNQFTSLSIYFTTFFIFLSMQNKKNYDCTN